MEKRKVLLGMGLLLAGVILGGFLLVYRHTHSPEQAVVAFLRQLKTDESVIPSSVDRRTSDSLREFLLKPDVNVSAESLPAADNGPVSVLANMEKFNYKKQDGDLVSVEQAAFIVELKKVGLWSWEIDHIKMVEKPEKPEEYGIRK